MSKLDDNSIVDEPTTSWVDHLTIGAALRKTAANFPQHDAYVFCHLDVRRTWQELDDDVDRVARGLLALGFRRGDHFGVWATNCPEWVLLQFATARIGVVLVTINPAYSASELSYTLSQADIRGIALIDRFKTTDFFEAFAEACPELATGGKTDQAAVAELQSATFPRLKWVISLRGDPRDGMVTFNELLRRADQVDATQLAAAEALTEPSDPINIQFTSGTTGQPKGAMLSHSNILRNAFFAGQCQKFDQNDRICLPVPLYHCFGCVLGTLCGAVHGSAVVFPSESFSAGDTLQAIEQERCTAVYGVPTMFIAQLQHDEFAKRNLTSLRTGIMAGSPCPIELMKRVTSEMGASEITIGYGQTESSPLITQTRTNDPLELRVGTVGRTTPGIECKIVDPETGADLSDNQPGELCGRGHGVMIGYYNMPEKTAKAVDTNGWLHTGDLAVRLPNGYFRITGRLRDLVIRGGENIYPREIEERLFAHPSVEDVQVVGVPDHKFGEELLAWVKLRSGTAATEDELKAFCREELAKFKVPNYWKFVDSFPTTVTGKIQKFRIREAAIAELGLQEAANIETA
jgi:fatty-acyl-CoA synthase